MADDYVWKSHYVWESHPNIPHPVFTLWHGERCAGVLMARTAYGERVARWEFYYPDGVSAPPLGSADTFTAEQAQNIALSIVITGVDLRSNA